MISEKEYQKLQNQFETNYVQANSTVEGIASSLAKYYMLQGDTNRINKQLDIYRTITKEDIKLGLSRLPNDLSNATINK